MKKTKQIRWTLEAASREFGKSRTTITNRLASAGIRPDADGTFSTKQICDAIFDSSHSAKVRESLARADLAEARKNILERKWLPAELVERAWSGIIRITRQRLLDVPGIVAGSDVKLSERIRKEIDTALFDLSKTASEKFYETQNEKAGITNDENEIE